MKTPTRMQRPTLQEETWLRAEINEVLMQHPLYGHRMATRARNILLDQIMDANYVLYLAEVEAEKYEMRA